MALVGLIAYTPRKDKLAELLIITGDTYLERKAYYIGDETILLATIVILYWPVVRIVIWIIDGFQYERNE